ncbi:MAG: hypothetical protein IPL48_16165, partial [Bacteroidetes bacterium]|nr:hypothetical protein [Bacteroidota bacterium]
QKFIPQGYSFKGAWMEFATDINNVMYAYIDRKKNLLRLYYVQLVAILMEDILELFGLAEEVKADAKTLKKKKCWTKTCRPWF